MEKFTIAIHNPTEKSVQAARDAGFDVVAHSAFSPYEFYNYVIKNVKSDVLGFIDGNVIVSPDLKEELKRAFSSVEPIVGAVYTDEMVGDVYNPLPSFSANINISPYFFMNGAIKDELFENVDNMMWNALLKINTACPIIHIAEPLLTVIL